MMNKLLCGVVDLLLGGESAESEANGRVRQVDVGTNGAQHVRRFERGGGASRARRQRDARKTHEQRFALYRRKTQVQNVWNATFFIAIVRHVLQ